MQFESHVVSLYEEDKKKLQWSSRDAKNRIDEQVLINLKKEERIKPRTDCFDFSSLEEETQWVWNNRGGQALVADLSGS